jgi:hypothetical protein
MPTADEPRESKVVLDPMLFRLGASIQQPLNLCPGLLAYQSFMPAVVGDAVPVKITGIDALAKDQVQGAPMKPPASNGPSLLPRLGCESLQGIPPRAELLKQTRNRWGIVVRNNDAPSIRPFHVAIACRCIARIQAAFGLLEHSLQRFLPQILRVVPGHQNLDAVNELL